VACVALGGDIQRSQETLDLLKDYIVQLRRYGHLESVSEVPGADGLTTAYLFQGNLGIQLFVDSSVAS